MHRSDQFTRRGGWSQRHPGELLLLSGGLALGAVLAPPPGGWLAAVMALVCLLGPARVPPARVLRALMPPLVFLILASLTLVLQIRVDRSSLTWWATDPSTALVAFQRGLGGTAAMLLLALTARLPELLRVLRSLGLPAAVCDIGLGMFRMLFVLASERRRMQTALTLRGGTRDLRSRWRGVVALTVGLLGRALARADRMDRALQLRSPAGLLAVVPQHAPLSAEGLVAAGAIVAIVPVALWALR